MSLQIDVSGEEGESSGDYFRYEDPNNGEATSYLVQQDFTLVNSYHMKPQAINLPEYTSCHIIIYFTLYPFKHDKPKFNITVTVALKFAHQCLSFLEQAELLSLMKSETSNAAKFYNHMLLVNLQESLRDGNTKYITSKIAFRQLLIRYEAYSRMFDTMPVTE